MERRDSETIETETGAKRREDRESKRDRGETNYRTMSAARAKERPEAETEKQNIYTALALINC